MFKGTWIAFAAVMMMASVSARAAETKRTGYVDIGRDEKLYVDYEKVDHAKATLVIMNGLTNSTTDWDLMMPELRGHGYSILRYDARGEGKTLDKHGAYSEAIKIGDQAEDLEALLKTLGIKGKADFLGFSYGGGLGIEFAARYPERIRSLILMDPFVGPSSAQVEWTQSAVHWVRMWNPWLMWTDAEIAHWIFSWVYKTGAPIAEPALYFEPLKVEATLHMTEGLWYDEEPLVKKFPDNSVYLMRAKEDTYITQEQFDRFWSNVPERTKMSRLDFDGSPHYVPEMAPHFASAWIRLILEQDPRVGGNRFFEGSALTGKVSSGDVKITLPGQ